MACDSQLLAIRPKLPPVQRKSIVPADEYDRIRRGCNEERVRRIASTPGLRSGSTSHVETFKDSVVVWEFSADLKRAATPTSFNKRHKEGEEDSETEKGHGPVMRKRTRGCLYGPSAPKDHNDVYFAARQASDQPIRLFGGYEPEGALAHTTADDEQLLQLHGDRTHMNNGMSRPVNARRRLSPRTVTTDSPYSGARDIGGRIECSDPSCSTSRFTSDIWRIELRPAQSPAIFA
ncbi:hypothetical protein BKA70DRAFT_1441770 [Coprinopsis sp. MPI-PUGE-AT-0042]|nr:hypothetical protein BKA70DRAFT_1441764 [Coprinopsis sp. MPI-PUGE-AT-0042]KAH6890757.1 hypothetical protein BKA70DRAFT_1441770 [Coprinopsis sp. MPI-PUGE-AT-0042]